MPYKIVISSQVQKQLDDLPAPSWQRVKDAVDRLAAQPRPHGAIKMKGASEYWRIRAGDHRIIYTIEDDRLVVLIIKIGHRGDVYR